jgi:hypothetical protein
MTIEQTLLEQTKDFYELKIALREEQEKSKNYYKWWQEDQARATKYYNEIQELKDEKKKV